MKDFWLAFVPMFAAMDPVGLIPFFLAFTADTTEAKRRRIILQSVLTAMTVALAFLFAGKALLQWLGVRVSDFLIAGGALLFVLALAELLVEEKPPQKSASVDESLGAVPLGVPLIVGPAVLATSLVLLDKYGYGITIAAIAANVLVTGLGLYWSEAIVRMIGKVGTRVISKVAALILAALAVMFIRTGLCEIISRAGAP